MTRKALMGRIDSILLAICEANELPVDHSMAEGVARGFLFHTLEQFRDELIKASTSANRIRLPEEEPKMAKIAPAPETVSEVLAEKAAA